MRVSVAKDARAAGGFLAGHPFWTDILNAQEENCHVRFTKKRKSRFR
jgi:hypothetical protein